jgi:hypothetical protein
MERVGSALTLVTRICVRPRSHGAWTTRVNHTFVGHYPCERGVVDLACDVSSHIEPCLIFSRGTGVRDVKDVLTCAKTQWQRNVTLGLYQNKPVLYNATLEEYRDRDLRAAAAKRISAALHISGFGPAEMLGKLKIWEVHTVRKQQARDRDVMC